MYIEESEIHAEVYTRTDSGIYLAKIAFPSLGMWINNITVRPSPKYPERGLWVQMPANRSGKRWYPSVQFRNDSKLKGLIEDEVLRAVERWNVEQTFPGAELLEGDELDKQLDEAISKLDDKPP